MRLDENWITFLENETSKEYFVKLLNFLENEYKFKEVYPEYPNIFRAFNLLPASKVKVVIIGQDPYHGPKQANGLAFSVSDDVKVPPSLANIYKELVSDIGCKYPENGNLSAWSCEGVLLMNTLLSVEKSSPFSHKNKGWEIFTDAVIIKLSQKFENLVFILWGAPSQKKESLIDTKKHLILKSAHPSPLSAYRGFFGSKPFSKTNDYLSAHSLSTVNWCLPNRQTLL